MTTKQADWTDDTRVTLHAAGNVPLKTRRRRTRLYTAYIWFAAVLFPLALLTIALLASRQLGAADPTAAQTQTVADSGAAAAQMEVERWLAQTPAPLPGGR